MKDTYWMKHDTNSARDERVLEMRADWGSEGYGLYWLINEYLREQSDCKADIQKINSIAYALNEDVEKIKKFIKSSLEVYGLYVSDDEFFWSERLLKDKEHFDKIREKNRENGKKGGVKTQILATVKQPLNRPLSETEATARAVVKRGEERRGDIRKVKKENYGEFSNVRLSQKEKEKAINKHGEQIFKLAVEKLSSYKKAKGRRYKSDYGAMTQWTFRAVMEDIEKNPIDSYVPEKVFKLETCLNCGSKVNQTLSDAALCPVCGALHELRGEKWVVVDVQEWRIGKGKAPSIMQKIAKG